LTAQALCASWPSHPELFRFAYSIVLVQETVNSLPVNKHDVKRLTDDRIGRTVAVYDLLFDLNLGHLIHGVWDRASHTPRACRLSLELRAYD
jgi:hypothetical protein